MGSENYKAVSTYINWWLNGFLVALYTVTLCVGNYIFPSVQGIQKNALGDLMHIPRIAFDVKVFSQVGGFEHGQKCLFLWELVFVAFLICIVFDIWLFFVVTRKLDPKKLGEFKLFQYYGGFFIVVLVLYFLYFASDLSLYGDKFDRRRLPVNATMFWFVVVVMLIVNMIVFHVPLFAHSYRRKKSLLDGKA